MNFELSDEQLQLQDSLNRLLADHAGFEQRRATVAGEPGYSRALWQRLTTASAAARST